ncbi:MAG: hypothetical protein LBL73_12855 [Synergistaceae bacterium]|jgi:hypothetical protein|nr:hypothetical protein [Synergistaceae bacterium]
MAAGWESIASDREDAPFLKLLSQDTISRMADKFSSFREDRVKIRNRMESYVRDYNACEGSATRRHEMLDEDIEWVEFSQGENGTSVSTNVVSDLAFSLSDRGIVERVMYGVNRKTPDMERTFLPEGETEDGLPDALRDILQSYLVTDSKEKIWFVFMKIVFSDGSESDIRIFDNPYADGVT